MIVKLDIVRTQWAVGNGFFHSGRISNDSDSITYVYDCGALSARRSQDALKREIETFSGRANSVDLMFISHYDYDHVSGVANLASRLPITRFILPLIPDAERLFYFAAHVANEPPALRDALGAGFYADFITDPETTLREAALALSPNVEVLFLVPASEPPPSDPAVPEIQRIAPAEVSPADAGVALQVARNGDTTQVQTGNGDVVWEWYPYVGELASKGTAAFAKALKDAGLIARRKDLGDRGIIENLVRNHPSDLADAYDQASRAAGKSFNRNLTSLMLYSGPVEGARHRAYRTASYHFERPEIGAWNPKPGWLGLGDANLRAQKRVREVNDVFATRKPLVGTFAPSHHGSVLDWNDSLMTGFDDTKRMPTYVFAASGAYRSRRDKAVLHPSGDVLLAINNAGGTAVTVGLDEASRWTERLTVYIEV